MEAQFIEIQQLRHSNHQLTAEIDSLRRNDEYRRELMSDLSTELSLSTSRETKLQMENQELKERSIAEEISFASRDRSISFEIDDILEKELEEAAVREALLQCEIAEAHSEHDALKEQHDTISQQCRAEEVEEELSRHIHEHGTPLPEEQRDITGPLLPSVELLADRKKEGDNESNQEAGNDNGSSQCPIQ